MNKLFKEIIQFSAKEQQKGGGSGLGLYISKGIMDLHKGRIGVRSEGLGKGSTFYLEFPCYTEADHAEHEQIHRNISANSSSQLSEYDGNRTQPTWRTVHSTTCLGNWNGGKIRVLLVDDSFTCRKMTIRLLHKFSIECVEASNGEDAINKVKESMQKHSPRFDGIIMDSEMPRMNGREAVLAIRGLGFLGKIFGCTGNTNKDEVDSFAANGADKVFMKPLDDKSFRSILKGMSWSSVIAVAHS